jgi:hypothetical protein
MMFVEVNHWNRDEQFERLLQLGFNSLSSNASVMTVDQRSAGCSVPPHLPGPAERADGTAA